jgi:cold shock CspA family protein
MSDGTVFGYAADMEMGVINTHDGQKYIFVKADWPSPEIPPNAGVLVTFEASGPVAKKIKIVNPS